MNKKNFGVAITLTVLILVLGAPIAYGEGPVAPTQVFKSTFPVNNPPSDFEIVADVMDWAPGAWTAPHLHGGAAYITVVKGELTYHLYGKETTYKAGQTWVENPGDLNQTGNLTDSPARTMVTFLLPKGAQLTTTQQVTGADVRVGPAPRKTETKFAALNPPSQFDLIQVEQDFAPGSQTAVHTHGGAAYITVLSGQLTLRSGGTEKIYSAGDTWTEAPGTFMQVVNNGTTPASTFVTFLLPKGATLTTNQSQSSSQATSPAVPVTGATSPASSMPAWLLPALGVAGLIVLLSGGVLIRKKFIHR